MDRKLFLVRSEAKAADLRPHFSDEWVIKSGVSIEKLLEAAMKRIDNKNG